LNFPVAAPYLLSDSNLGSFLNQFWAVCD